MRGKISASHFLLLSLMLFLASAYVGSTREDTHEDALATVSVVPSLVTVTVGQDFSINVTISNVVDLYGWEFRLNWTASLIDPVNAAEGPFLKAGGSTIFTYETNATAGSVLVDCTLLGNIPGVSGSGTLAILTFQVKSAGQSPLNLNNVTLINSLEQSIPNQEVSGNGHFVYPSHDVAITNVVSSKTIVGQGFSTSIIVTAADQGIYTETFKVTAYANATVIASQNITLSSGNAGTITFTWNTTSFARGKYTIKAYAWPVPGETDTADNTFVDGTVQVAKKGDLNGDGSVDVLDLIVVAKALGTHPGDPKYNPNADINGDGEIDVLDLIIVAKYLGT
jgi:hypothetical protein